VLNSAWLGVLLLGVGTVAWALTGVVRRYALASGVLDVPGARSSHTAPVPRGGGLAIVAAFAGGLVLLVQLGTLPASLATALLGAGLPVAGVGFIDDHRSLGVCWRLSIHFVAAWWVWMVLGPDLNIPVGESLRWLLAAATVLGLVWLLNLFNFMDGIDGIAGIEAISVAVGGALLGWLAGGQDAWLAPLLLGAATLGFLVWNWPPARIFLGDAGSGFLGLSLGVLALDAARARPSLLCGWAVLIAVFVADASVTLLRRALRRERLALAHRSHTYQRLARRWGSHRPVTLLVGVVNLLWLYPLAVAIVYWPKAAAALTMLAYAPLLLATWRLGAGRDGDD
jgi:Fuc2NAc and GlcNAc transferase